MSTRPFISYSRSSGGRKSSRRAASSAAASAAYAQLQREMFSGMSRQQQQQVQAQGSTWWVGGQASDPSMIGGLQMTRPVGGSVTGSASSRRRGRRAIISPIGPGTVNLLSDKPLATLVPNLGGLFSGTAQTTDGGLFGTGGAIASKVEKPKNKPAIFDYQVSLRDLKAPDVPSEIQGTDLFDVPSGKPADYANIDVLAFGNDPNDPLSMALSPQLCERVDPTSPIIGGLYPTVSHYVEIQRINTATPAVTALGIVGQNAELNPTDKCAMARASTRDIQASPYIPIVRSISMECNVEAAKNKFFYIEVGAGRYLTSLFLGLWNKITTHPTYFSALVNTGKKFLLYVDETDQFMRDGVNPADPTPKGEPQGDNFVGLFLMIIRAIIVKFPNEVYAARTNPADLYRKVAAKYVTFMKQRATGNAAVVEV